MAFCAPLWAQVDTGTISGIVLDRQGAAMPGAAIVVTNLDTNATLETVTNERGLYTVPQLKIGSYSVAASLPGFKTEVRTGITLQVQQVARVDFTLQVGEITDRVTVTAEAPLLETETSSVGQVINSKTIADLPLNGRNYLQLARLSAGVLEPPRGDRAAEGGSFVANGVRATLNNFILDGVDNNSKIVDLQNSSNVVIQPSVDAIEEFKVQTHNFSAEFGHSAGAVINATIKSGTNEFHGTAFEFLRNDVFDARDFFSRPGDPKAPLRRNQFGGTVGGPMVKNKSFFFASWERTIERRGLNYVRTLPDDAVRRGDFSGERTIFDPNTVRPRSGGGFLRDPFPGNVIPAERMDPVALRVLSLLPQPNLPGRVNNYVSNPKRKIDRDQFDFRVDHTFSDKDKFFTRYSFTNGNSENPGPFPPPLVGSNTFQQAEQVRRAKGLAVGESHTFGPTRINEFRFGYNRIRDDLLPFVKETLFDAFGFRGIPREPGVTGLPRIAIPGFADLGEATFLPNFKISETFQINDDISLVRGNHSLKTGFNLRYVRSFFNISGQARGSFTFNGVFTQDPQSRARTGSAFADFLLGLASSATLSNLTLGDIRYQYWGGYVQDDWKVSRNFTLNLGLRYELVTPPVERHDQQGNFLIAERKLIFPDNQTPAGIPSDLVTAIPSGAHRRGLLKTDKNNFAPRIGFAYRFAPATVVRGGAGVFYADHPAVGASGRLVASPPFRREGSFPTDQIQPQIILREGFPLDTLGLRRLNPSITDFRAWSIDFPQAYTYHWSLDVQREFSWLLVDVGYTGTKGTQLTMGVDFNQPLPGPGSVASRRPIQGFGPISGQLPGNNSNYHALLVRAERRFSQGLGFLASYTLSKSIDYGGEQLIGDLEARSVQNLRWERSLSRFDLRHRLAVNYMWDLPVGRNRRFDPHSDVLDAVLGGWQINGITTVRSGAPFTPTLGFSTANTGSPRPDRIRDGNLPRNRRTPERFFDVDAFAPAEPFNFGNAGKNILFGPGAVNFDVSLFKRIHAGFLGERGEVQFRVEAFNVLNTPQFGIPNARVDLPQGGSIRSLSAPMREMQFGVKILF